MSFSFTVAAAELPPFSDVLAEANLSVRPELKGAGELTAGWPRGLIQKIPDGSNGPSKLEMSPQLEAMFAKLGLSGSFVACTPGKSTRGVEVTRQRDGVRFRVCALSTIEDYTLAAQLAVATARVTRGCVHPEHGYFGDPVEPLQPDAFLETFNGTFFKKNAREMSESLLAEVAAGTAWYFTVGIDWVRLEPSHLAGVPAEERLARARDVLMEGPPPAAAPAVDPQRREALLITKAMLYAAAADGKLDPEEVELLQVELMTVPGISGYDSQKLITDAEVLPMTALLELPLPARRKAFVLAAELLACTRGGKIAGETSDPNVKAAMALATSLQLQNDEAFIIDVGACVAAKFIADPVPREVSRTFLEAMLLAAAADGRVSDEEQGVIAALSRTVPQLKVGDFAVLMQEAQARVLQGLEVVAADLRALPKFKNKCWLLACEVALCTGERDENKAMLEMLRGWIKPQDEFVPRPFVTCGAKYASRESDGKAALAKLLAGAVAVSTTRSPLQAVAERALDEGVKQVLADTYYFAVLVTERGGVMESRLSSQGYLPDSVNELKAHLAKQTGVDRYAISYPGLSFFAGGSVVVAEAGDASAPKGLRIEQRYQPRMPQGPSKMLGQAAAGHAGESLLYEPRAEGAVRFSITEIKRGEWVSYACRAGEVSFELAMKMAPRAAHGIELAEGRLQVSAEGAQKLFGLNSAIDATASAVVLSTRALRDSNGFSSEGGTWLCSKWTVQGNEFYVNLQPEFFRGELKPRESTLGEALGPPEKRSDPR